MRAWINFGGASASTCFAGFVILLMGCADVTNQETVDKSVAALTTSDLKGAPLLDGEGLRNRCVRDVPAAFLSLPPSPTNTAAYVSKAGQRLPPYDATLQLFIPFQLSLQPSTITVLGINLSIPFTPSVPHVQSLTRFELGDQQDDRWFAVSRAYEGVNKAGFFLVHLSDMSGANGGPLLEPGVNYLSPVPPDRATQFYYPTDGSPHPGGMQAFGRYLAVAEEAPSGTSWVDIYDFAAGFGNGALINRVMMFSDGFPVEPDLSITAVAVTRLNDGRYLMFVLGKDNHRRGWFFVSRDASPASTWDPFDYFDGTTDAPSQSFQLYQNVTFITECGSGDLYLLATGNTELGVFSDGTNYADLFKLEADPAVGVRMTRLSSRNFDPGTNGACTFRAAATGYAVKENRLALYCHAYPQTTLSLGAGGGVIGAAISPNLKFVEYAPPPGCLFTEVACGSSCCDSGDSCIDGACCAAGDVCGSTCCGGDDICVDANQSLCCSPLSTPCGSGCCDLGQECVDGTCQEPPPPPPPPPGTCPTPDIPTCSTPADCPPNLALCEGGCCRRLQ